MSLVFLHSLCQKLYFLLIFRSLAMTKLKNFNKINLIKYGWKTKEALDLEWILAV